jgi:hypothetical protein
MNWRIKVDGEAVIVSQSEHDEVVEGIKAKMDLISLREGKVLINPRFIRTMMETNEETESQYAEKLKTLPSPEEDIDRQRDPIRKLFVQSHDEFYKKMGWPV